MRGTDAARPVSSSDNPPLHDAGSALRLFSGFWRSRHCWHPWWRASSPERAGKTASREPRLRGHQTPYGEFPLIHCRSAETSVGTAGGPLGCGTPAGDQQLGAGL